MRVLFELAKQAALLHLQVEALERRVDRFVRLYGYVNQIGRILRQSWIMAGFCRTGQGGARSTNDE